MQASHAELMAAAMPARPSPAFISHLMEVKAAMTSGLPGPLGSVQLEFGPEGLVCEADAMFAALVAHEHGWADACSDMQRRLRGQRLHLQLTRATVLFSQDDLRGWLDTAPPDGLQDAWLQHGSVVAMLRAGCTPFAVAVCGDRRGRGAWRRDRQGTAPAAAAPAAAAPAATLLGEHVLPPRLSTSEGCDLLCARELFRALFVLRYVRPAPVNNTVRLASNKMHGVVRYVRGVGLSLFDVYVSVLRRDPQDYAVFRDRFITMCTFSRAKGLVLASVVQLEEILRIASCSLSGACRLPLVDPVYQELREESVSTCRTSVVFWARDVYRKVALLKFGTLSTHDEATVRDMHGQVRYRPREGWLFEDVCKHLLGLDAAGRARVAAAHACTDTVAYNELVYMLGLHVPAFLRDRALHRFWARADGSTWPTPATEPPTPATEPPTPPPTLPPTPPPTLPPTPPPTLPPTPPPTLPPTPPPTPPPTLPPTPTRTPPPTPTLPPCTLDPLALPKLSAAAPLVAAVPLDGVRSVLHACLREVEQEVVSVHRLLAAVEGHVVALERSLSRTSAAKIYTKKLFTRGVRAKRRPQRLVHMKTPSI